MDGLHVCHSGAQKKKKKNKEKLKLGFKFIHALSGCNKIKFKKKIKKKSK